MAGVATNLSDLLRYQNMLCRYDTMALKSLDIFSIHGFPVGLVTVNTCAEALWLVPPSDLPEMLQHFQIVFVNNGRDTIRPIRIKRTVAHTDPRFVGLLEFSAPVGRS